MWIIEGTFDGLDAVGRTKRKVLYPGNSYELGRGSVLLHLAQTVVSTHHATITVGPHPVESASDPQAIPKLEYTQCNKKKTAVVSRLNEDGPRISPNQTAELKSGDQVHISGAQISVRVTWEPVNLLIRNGIPRDERDELSKTLAKLGIKSSRVWSDQVTHTVFSAVSHPFDFKILAALVHGVHLVSPAWLRHVVQKADAVLEPGNESKSENYQMTFQGLEEEAYRPDGAGLQIWAPNQARRTLFSNIRFLFLTATDLPRDIFDVFPKKELITQHQIMPDDTTTVEEWTKKLDAAMRAIGKLDPKPGMSAPFVVGGDSKTLEQTVGPRWQDVYLTGLQRKGIRLVWLAELSEALLKIDLSYVDSLACSAPADSVEAQGSQRLPDEAPKSRRTRASSRQPSLPPAVPSSHPDESTIGERNTGSTNTKKPIRRVTNRKETPSFPEPSVQPPDDAPQPAEHEEPKPEPVDDIPIQRIALKRRAPRRAPSAEPAANASVPTFSMDFSLDVPEIPAIRGLKRRATGRAAQSNALDQMSGPSAQLGIPEEEEPRHKRFKALFEGTQGPLQSADIMDDSAAAGWGIDAGSSSISDPLAGSISRPAAKRKAGQLLEPLDEVMESQEATREAPGKRRRTDSPSLEESHSQQQSKKSSELREGIQPNQSTSPTDESQSYRPSLEPGLQDDKENPKSKSSKRAQNGAAQQANAETTVKPDQDQNFLQALASRTKTKSKEDDFDREFNKLRIAVPDKSKSDSNQIKKDMEVWNELDHDPNVRGNFMVVEFREDMFRPDRGLRSKAFNVAWEGAPNFKKFRKKNDGAKRPKLELDLPAPVDYGLGDSYWQRDDPNVTIGAEVVPTSQPLKQIPRRRPLDLKINTSSDEEAPLQPIKRGRTKKAAPVIDLHFSDSEEALNDAPPEEESEIFDMNVSVVDEDDDAPISSNTLRSSGSRLKSQRQGPSSTHPTQSQRSSRNTSGSKRKAAALPDSDDEDDDHSDDNTAFRGFNRKKKMRR